MYIPFETLLPLGIVAFYLYDSAKLLYFNEVVFLRGWRAWGAICITSRWTIKGKSLLLPNPITPFFPLVSLYWTLSPRKLKATDINSSINSLKPLSAMAFTSMLLMIFVVPVVIKFFGTGLYLLFVFALIYMNIISMIFYISIKRSTFNLTTKQLIAFCFDILACPPFSINVVRKLSLRITLKEDAIQFALKNLSKPKLEQLLISLHAKLNERLEGADDPVECKSIEKYQSKIKRLLT